MNPQFVYHVSAKQGLRIFQPRPFWHDKTRSATGPLDAPADADVPALLRQIQEKLTAMGLLQAGAPLPEGFSIAYGVFASDRPWPMFFAPSELKSIGVGVRPEALTAIKPTTSYPASGNTTYLFEQRDEEKMRRHRFSIYTFEAAPFQRFPAGEYVAPTSVCPLKETVHEDALTEMLKSGISVVFVNDMDLCYEALKRSGMKFQCIRHIAAAFRDAVL